MASDNKNSTEFSNSITVETKVDYKHELIEQSTSIPDYRFPLGNQVQEMTRKIIDLQETGVREALEQLGWIPPESHNSVLLHFSQVYLSNKYKDPHAELATRLGITRQEAKRQCYEFLYNSQFIQDYAKSLSESSDQ